MCRLTPSRIGPALAALSLAGALAASAGPRVAGPSGYVRLALAGREWVFRDGSPELAAARDGVEPPGSVVRARTTAGGVEILAAPDEGTLEAYLACRPGFAARSLAGRLWVFREGSSELAAADAGDLPELPATRVRSLRRRVQVLTAPDAATLADYLALAPGFVVRVVAGQAWVAREGSPEDVALASGDVPKASVGKVMPDGRVVRAGDVATLDAWHEAGGELPPPAASSGSR